MVPLVALVTTLVLQAVQLLVMQIAGQRRGMSLSEVLMQWDSQWMTLISRHGYSGFAMGSAGTPDGEPIEWQSVAFFPGYPWLVRVLASGVRVLTGAEATIAVAQVVSAVASVALVWGLGRIAVDHLWPAVTGKDAASPLTSGALTVAVGTLALGAPMSVVYVMPYSEALYTALAVWAVLMLLRRSYLTAGLLVFLAGLTRLTAVVLVLTLAVAAVVELWRWWRTRERGEDALRAVVSPLIGVAGIVAYLAWANGQTAAIGGYFAAQDRGWHSGFDYGAATWHWITTSPLDITTRVGAGGSVDGTMPGYAISAWSMILVGLLCVVSLWPLVTGRLPWQLWLPAVAVAGMTLGSDGIMHSRPRLLLIPVLFLLLPLVVRALARLRAQLPDRPWLASVPVFVAVAWCVVGFWVSVEMLVEFAYAI
ncbi:hypothetical protein A606_10630 [Corynebacterium terpenotabidum Y-11]|uniref:Integral membrane protein n=1 Tax=Corynebacterium terpenotabidum Y-11 TaxID=1200352 RepID=S4XJ33_9CORY|nr:hypothetical protein A606_10630 [Corynebacterium terpenotabidum Y-11]